MLETKKCPPELGYVNDLKRVGVTITLKDYQELASLNRDDLAVWNEAEAQRTEDEIELQKQGNK